MINQRRIPISSPTFNFTIKEVRLMGFAPISERFSACGADYRIEVNRSMYDTASMTL
jgi:hypothetical protein